MVPGGMVLSTTSSSFEKTQRWPWARRFTAPARSVKFFIIITYALKCVPGILRVERDYGFHGGARLYVESAGEAAVPHGELEEAERAHEGHGLSFGDRGVGEFEALHHAVGDIEDRPGAQVVALDIGDRVAEMVHGYDLAGHPVAGLHGEGEGQAAVFVEDGADLLFRHAPGDGGGYRRHDVAAVEGGADAVHEKGGVAYEARLLYFLFLLHPADQAVIRGHELVVLGAGPDYPAPRAYRRVHHGHEERVLRHIGDGRHQVEGRGLYVLRRDLVGDVDEGQAGRLGKQDALHHGHEGVMRAEVRKQGDALGFHNRGTRGGGRRPPGRLFAVRGGGGRGGGGQRGGLPAERAVVRGEKLERVGDKAADRHVEGEVPGGAVHDSRNAYDLGAVAAGQVDSLAAEAAGVKDVVHHQHALAFGDLEIALEHHHAVDLLCEDGAGFLNARHFLADGHGPD